VFPRKWLEIGQAYEELRGQGLKYGAILKQLKERFTVGTERTIEHTLKRYREAMAEIDQINNEERDAVACEIGQTCEELHRQGLNGPAILKQLKERFDEHEVAWYLQSLPR
jgi:hypothetical protein